MCWSHYKDILLWDHLIFMMGIPILVRRYPCIETTPGVRFLWKVNADCTMLALNVKSGLHERSSLINTESVSRVHRELSLNLLMPWVRISYRQRRRCSMSQTMCTWWRHQMETFSALLVRCEGKQPVTGGFPSQRPVMPIFDVFFDPRLNRQLSKQSRRRWFETSSRSLWRHPNDVVVVCCIVLWLYYQLSVNPSD